MSFYYLSFCDPNKPKGSQFLGACVVEAHDERGAYLRATALGINPGGEIAMWEIDATTIDDIPPEGRKYLDSFVPREVVMSEGYMEPNIEASGVVCAECNE